MNQCGIIILAAGASTRMGVAKQSLEFQGSTLLRRAVDTAVASVCRPVVVVLGARADELFPLVDEAKTTVVINREWERGIGTSIRAGVASIRSMPADAVMIFLCDQPLILATALDRMVESHFASAKKMAAAAYAGALGTPAIFSASLFDELLALDDSQGGKAVLNRHPDQVHAFDLPDAEIDLDTMADFKRLSQQLSDFTGPV
jgi:molybdenum cofactor cytidylyltransferase